MLETCLPEAIEKLMVKPGRLGVDQIEIASLPPRQIIRVVTVSGNQYLFEVTNPDEHKAHVVRYKSGPRVPQSGYRGERVVSEIFKVGRCIFHDKSNTSPVVRIILVN